MTIAQVKEGLGRIKKIYPYKEDKTEIRLDRNSISNIQNQITIETSDEETGVFIHLEATAKHIERGTNE